MKRRKFIGGIIIGTLGTTLDLHRGYCGEVKNRKLNIDELKCGFLNPPDSAKPHTWYHWREGRINTEAITAELEAMKSIGLGGVTLFAVASYGEIGQKIPCLSSEWHDRIRFTMRECKRIGLSFNFQNCPGWSHSGGPWITPDKNMMRVVSTKHMIDGGFTLKLDAPPSWPDSGDIYYRDIAVLAFPTPIGYKDLSLLPASKVTSNFIIGDLTWLNKTLNRDTDFAQVSTQIINQGESGWVQFEFPTVVTCRSVTITGSPNTKLPDEHRVVIFASDNGFDFKKVVRLSSYFSVYHRKEPCVNHAIPKTKARFFRLVWEGPAKLSLSRILLSSEPVIYSQNSKTGELGRTFIDEPILPIEMDSIVPLDSILDITHHLDTQNKLTWTAPLGKSWTVVRIGYRSTGKRNAPAAPEATGLECDKFNPEAVALHFDRYAGEIIKDAEAVDFTNLAGITFDSWEAESQNWSPVFRDEFRKRRGYDVLNYLPAFTGFIVENREQTDRFLRDIRQTMSDLVSETFFGGMRKLAHKYGLQVHAEACGGGGAEAMTSDPVQHYLHADIPMNEFGDPLKVAVSSAHIKGQRVVAIEAYTQGRADWNSHPALLKPQGDMALCTGVTRFVFHTYAHNPDIEKIYPGPAFGPYGLAFSRGETWWEMGRAWIDYLSRCQFLLQTGKSVSDVLYFYGEEPGGPIPMVLETGYSESDKWAKLPYGFDYDLLPPEILIKDLSFKNGKFVLPSGTAYRLLVLRNSSLMTPEAAEKIKSLVKDGAIVLGPKPQRSLSLSNYPLCDEIVKKIGEEVWGNCDGKTAIRNSFGKGQVFWGITLKEVFNIISLSPDFSVTNSSENSNLLYIHRQDEDTDIYFISNQSDSIDFEAVFRVEEKKPEIWNPVNGSIKDTLDFYQKDGTTHLTLHLDSKASVFVIFRETVSKYTTSKTVGNNSLTKQKSPVNGPWEVKFTPGWGAPETIEFTELEDWSKRPENGIKYYSGTAIYSTSFNWDTPIAKNIIIDLGRVEVIAEVKLNGKICGIVWTPPFQIEITSVLKQGRNDLEIKVANTWLNRLMGDGKGINMGAEKHSWTSCNPFTNDPKYTVSGVPVRIYSEEKTKPVISGLLGPVNILENEN